jgi:hypothetical protein
MARIRIRSALAAAFCGAIWISPMAHAYDEVDYSAPYVTVENGVLVTKYPDLEHGGEASLEGASFSPEPAVVAAMSAVIGSLVIAAFMMARRSRRKRLVGNGGGTVLEHK